MSEQLVESLLTGPQLNLNAPPVVCRASESCSLHTQEHMVDTDTRRYQVTRSSQSPVGLIFNFGK